MNTQTNTRKAYLVGGGIAGFAAAYLIKDGGFLGANITIYEEGSVPGGCLDAASTKTKTYSSRGERMFENNYVCMYDLLSFIPSIDDPTKSIKEDILEFAEASRWNNKARLVDKDGIVTNFRELGFDERDRLDIIALTSSPEALFNDKHINEVFKEHFFQTNFWYICSPPSDSSHGTAPSKCARYMLRFMHRFPSIATQAGIYRTKYNQFDSIVRPMKKWLGDQGVNFVTNTRVTDVDLGGRQDKLTASHIWMVQNGLKKEVDVSPQDIALVTIGSMVADSSLGSNDRAPELITDNRSGAFKLWENLAAGRKVLGNPSVFTSHISESKWESFTVTTRDPRFSERMEEFTGNAAGHNGLVTLKDSSWLLTLSLYPQPYFREQPADVLRVVGFTASTRINSAIMSASRCPNVPELRFLRSRSGS